MPDLALPDIQLHYEVSGDGPPLLLIAGMMSDSASWAPLEPLLAPHFTVIRPDNRTTGRTTPWDAPVSLVHYAEDCLALLDHLGHTRAHVAGHSLGGLIALTLHKAAPERIIDITFLASAPMRLPRNVALFETLLTIRRSNAPKDTWLRALFPWLFSAELFETPKAVDDAIAAALTYPFAQSTEAMAHQLTALTNVSLDPLSGPYQVPVQALLAENDQMIPLTGAQAALGDAPYHIVSNAGHSIHWDAPHAVADHILNFISRA